MTALKITIADQDGIVLEQLTYKLGDESNVPESMDPDEWPYDLSVPNTRRVIGEDVESALDHIWRYDHAND